MSYVSIKGTMKGLVISINGNPLFENIESELIKKLNTRKGFFKQASFRFEGDQNLKEEEKQALINLCLEHGMLLDKKIAAPAVRKEDHSYMRHRNDHFNKDDNIVINRNVRSGQKVIAKKDLVVVGNVNPGAELIAGGNIVVMGSLRGMAHAGSEGDLLATVTAQEMLPSQIRIANIVACNPDREETIPIIQTEIAYVKDNKIVVEQYSNSNKTFRGTSISA